MMDRQNTNVMILCGGKGTRIRDVSELMPKPMLPIGGKPVLWHIMKNYAHYGYKSFVLCLGYKGNSIKEFFLNYRPFTEDIAVSLGTADLGSHIEFLEKNPRDDWKVVLAETGDESYTGDRVKRASRYIKGETFMLTYGDGVGNVDIAALMEFHKSHGKMVTVTGVHPPGRFGELATSGEIVTEFNEKPQVKEGMINGGFFVISKKFVEQYMEHLSPLALEDAPLRQCAADGEMRVFAHKGYWQPMDTQREFNLLNELWDSGSPPWKLWND
jgi:glucose-1-phosphate cytidylyltransferase